MAKPYESEHTRFMREWLEKNPETVAVKQKGRALWWDKAPLTPDERRRIEESRIAQNSYCYYD